nr:Hint domain-containing protein [Gymnodinialimonas phycosphaerae]
MTATLPAFATDMFEVFADITTVASTQDINVALVIDTSGSTSQSSGSDVDVDGVNDTFLAAQKLAAKQVFVSLLDAGDDPEYVTIMLIEYNSNGNTRGDLNLSRQHRVLGRDWQADLLFGSPDGVLTPAFTLINETDIGVDLGADGVEYFRIAFDTHEVIYSEGLETESFHPAGDIASVLSEPQRDELYAIFPPLEEGLATMPAARIGLKGRDGHALNTRSIWMTAAE